MRLGGLIAEKQAAAAAACCHEQMSNSDSITRGLPRNMHLPAFYFSPYLAAQVRKQSGVCRGSRRLKAARASSSALRENDPPRVLPAPSGGDTAAFSVAPGTSDDGMKAP